MSEILKPHMIEPTRTELSGLRRLLAWLEQKKCEDITNKPCGCIRSDECDACIELESAADFIRQTIKSGEKIYESR